MYSVREAAARMGVTDRHVRLLLAKGTIPGKKLGHDWVVLALDYNRKRKPKAGKRLDIEGTGSERWEGTWMEGGL